MKRGWSGWTEPSVVISIVALLSSLAIGITTIKASYDLYGKGNTPPKSLKADYLPTVDPLTDLRRAEGQVKFTVESEHATLSNLKLRQAILTNDGKAPILPSDVVEPLSIRTAPPWRIVSVVDATAKSPSAVRIKWERLSETEFRSAPTLLNPGDFMALTVYMTNTAKTEKHTSENQNSSEEPPLEWSTRIVNLKSIATTPTKTSQEIADEMGPITVNIWGAGVPFILASFLAFLALYISSLTAIGAIGRSMKRNIIFILPSGLISLCAAEAGTTYVFGPWPFTNVKIDHLANAPIVLLNAVALFTLTTIAVQRLRQRRASAPQSHDS